MCILTLIRENPWIALSFDLRTVTKFLLNKLLLFDDKAKVFVFHYLKFEKHPQTKQNFIFCHRISKSDSKASIFINFLFSKLDLEGVCNLLRKTNCHLS